MNMIKIVFLLKITIGMSFLPSAVQESTTVNLIFSCPIVLSNTVFVPLTSSPITNHIKIQGVSHPCSLYYLMGIHVSFVYLLHVNGNS